MLVPIRFCRDLPGNWFDNSSPLKYSDYSDRWVNDTGQLWELLKCKLLRVWHEPVNY